MKDYTKYDFAAIVGAEVRIEIKGKTIKGVLRSYVHDKGVGGINGTLWIEDEAGFMHSTHEAFILSLTAKIKVEDATLQQLKKHFQLSHTDSLVFDNDRVFSCYIIEGELENVYDGVFVHDYIDCTDWGWKHE